MTDQGRGGRDDRDPTIWRANLVRVVGRSCSLEAPECSVQEVACRMGKMCGPACTASVSVSIGGFGEEEAGKGTEGRGEREEVLFSWASAWLDGN